MAKRPAKRKRHLTLLIVLCLAAAFAAAWFLLPSDVFLARKQAEKLGYEIPASYEDAESRYYYQKLDKTEQTAYRVIVEELPDFPERIAIPELDDDQLQETYSAISYDNPTYFFLATTCTTVRFGGPCYFIPKYIMSKDEYEAKLAQMEAAADKVIAGAPNGTEYERELYVHDYIGKTTSYKDDKDPNIYTPYGVLINKRANCEGYARCTQYLLNRLGIVNHLISGTGTNSDGKTENHMWNVVAIDGQDYNVDSTWDDYVISGAREDTEPAPSHVYFNMSADDMKLTHKPDDPADWEGCTSEKAYYLNVNDQMWSSYSASAVKDALVRQLAAGNTSIEFRFTNAESYNTAVQKLFNNSELYDLIALADMRVSAKNRVEANRVQYATDDHRQVIRVFMIR